MKKNAGSLEPKHWTQAEIRELKRLYPMSHNKDLTRIFGRPAKNILYKAKRLGIKKDWAGGYRVQPPPQNENLWTAAEIETLRRMYPACGAKEIAAELKRSPMAVQSKVRKLGLFRELNKQGLRRKFGGKNHWTDEEIALLKELYPLKSRAQIAEQIGRSPNGVGRMACKLKLSYLRTCPHRKSFWTAENDAFLKEHIAIWPLEKIAEKLGRKPYTIQRRAWRKHFLRNCPNKAHTKQRPWTTQEIKQLEYWLPQFSTREIAARLGRSVQSVGAKLKQLKLKRPPFWNHRNISILKKYFPFQTNTEVAKRLGTYLTSVSIKAAELGLKKSIYAGYKRKC